MLDEKGKALYVGKARDLKNRVNNYTSLAGKNNRLSQMILQTASMEFVTTRNEAEALLLEANLIKQLQPRYNILLRDGKSYPYLRISAHEFPRVSKYRGQKKGKDQYFGPFPSAGDVEKTVKQLQRVFQLRPCKDSMFESRTRPCLQHQIKRCSAPCVDYISPQDYDHEVKQAIRFLTGKSQQVQEDLRDEMLKASENLEFEQAARLRDRLKALGQIQRQQGLHLTTVKNADMIAIVREGNAACVQLFLIREGQNFGNIPHFLNANQEQSDAEVLAAFLPQFYQNQTAPKQLLVNIAPAETELLEEALQTRIHQPQRGEKAEAMEQVLRNAKQALRRYLDEKMGNHTLIEKVAELFELEQTPDRIEVYDNSHISGNHAVGGMIVAGAEGFLKQHYRQFTIKEAAGDDDFGMMREVLTRRLKRLKDDFPENPPLLLIDGGKGQLSAVRAVMEKLELWGEVPVVAIAKGPDRNAGREEFHLPGKAPFMLPLNDPVLHYLQRLRDEAHRFAIGSHRNKRSSALKKSELDEIPGIGAKRKRALLQHFGSAKAVANASVEELEKVEGINAKTATTIWQQFHS